MPFVNATANQSRPIIGEFTEFRTSVQRLRFLLGGALLLACAACAGPKFVGRPDLQLVDGSSLPPPATVDLISKERAYLIGPLDRVAIDVYGVGELSRSVQVDASGRIALPLIGSLQASGKTPSQLADEIETKLRGRFVREPNVTVNLTETLSQVITVDGAVSQPGLYPVVGRMTLMRAIARAQGTTEFARENHIVVFRTVDNKRMAALYDLRAIRQGIYDDPEVYANDVVLVGDSNARRVFRDVLSASGILAAPLVAVLQ